MSPRPTKTNAPAAAADHAAAARGAKRRKSTTAAASTATTVAASVGKMAANKKFRSPYYRHVLVFTAGPTHNHVRFTVTTSRRVKRLDENTPMTFHLNVVKKGKSTPFRLCLHQHEFEYVLKTFTKFPELKVEAAPSLTTPPGVNDAGRSVTVEKKRLETGMTYLYVRQATGPIREETGQQHSRGMCFFPALIKEVIPEMTECLDFVRKVQQQKHVDKRDNAMLLCKALVNEMPELEYSPITLMKILMKSEFFTHWSILPSMWQDVFDRLMSQLSFNRADVDTSGENPYSFLARQLLQHPEVWEDDSEDDESESDDDDDDAEDSDSEAASVTTAAA